MMRNHAKCVIFAILLGASSSIFAQNVGINVTGATPSVNAILDLNTGNTKKLGLLIPRVVLGTSLTTFNPPMAGANTGKDSGMVVFNWLATNQPVGFYYWNGSTWGNVASSSWFLTGNSGTTASTAIIGHTVNNNFIGTTDAKDFVFATNDLERMRITSAGSIGIGTKSPASTLDDSGSIGTGTYNIAPVVSSATNLGSGYSTVIATPPAVSQTYTLTLPSAVTYIRRIYTVVYNGSAAGTIDITSSAGNIEENGTPVTPLALSQGTVTFQSDGTNWDILNITTANAYGSFVGIKYITATTGSALSFDAGTNSIQIRLIGGGGAGGGGSTNNSNSCGNETDVAGSGGGSGGYLEGFLNGLTGSSTYSVTIGKGGTGDAKCSGTADSGTQTILTITAPSAKYYGFGGKEGASNPSDGSNTYATGGVGGTSSSTAATGTYLAITGATGASGVISTADTHLDASGTGASTTFGPGGSALTGRSINEPGVSALAYGAGGGGAIIAQKSTTETGGTGASGVVIIYEYQ